ncbi:MAG: glycoside hydrolase family 3 C-terminal domain-containing protein [Bacteroidales bacterium]|nr:glycoside hydrolase family 3 C-terminal domain-containing protein [Bacteroidales bacterium]
MNYLTITITGAALLAATAASAEVKLAPNTIDKVLKEMTLEEKAKLLTGYSFGVSYWGLPSDPDPNAEAIVLGAAGNTAKIDRLGIPHTILADGPAGVHISAERGGDDRRFYTTAIPIGSLISSSWDPEMAYAMGDVVGQECLDYGVDVILGPGLNLMRNPLCGRNFEYYSEDPFLSGNIAAGYVNGVQAHGVGTSPKHFAANSQEGNRSFNNAIVDQRPLRELYLKGFEIMVKKSQPWTIMSSYNYINGQYTQESHDLLEDILRDEWGFKGIVMTDWTNTRNTAKQMHAGNDLLTPGNAEQIEQIVAGVNDGSIKIADVDRNVKRILQYIVKTPRFKGTEYAEQTDLTAHAAIVRQCAPQGMVLLQNAQSTLPISQPEGKKVALFGTHSYSFYSGGSGSGDVNSLLKVNLNDGLTAAGFVLDPLISDTYEKYAAFAKAEAEAGMGIHLTSNSYFPRSRVAEAKLGKYSYLNAAQENDLAIITIARKSGEGGDRLSEDYPLYPDEIEMLSQVSAAFHAQGKPVVVVLNTGGPLETEPIKRYADAILLAWQPGVYAGHSVADVLTGKNYPSGKLPMTWPVAINDVPSTANFPDHFDWRDEMQWGFDKINATPNLGNTNYAEGLNVGYRYFATADKPVSYPFGYGLSYTTFEYSAPVISRKGDKYTATVTVTNTGDAAGREAVQLYVSAPKGTLEKPKMELKAFGKTAELQPGESQQVTMEFTNYDLASFDESKSAFVTDAGEYQALFAASAADVRQSAPFTAKAATYKVHNSLPKQ